MKVQEIEANNVWRSIVGKGFPGAPVVLAVVAVLTFGVPTARAAFGSPSPAALSIWVTAPACGSSAIEKTFAFFAGDGALFRTDQWPGHGWSRNSSESRP